MKLLLYNKDELIFFK